MSVDKAGRHRQSPGIEALAVRAGGTELGDTPVFDGDVDGSRPDPSTTAAPVI
ncbi:hypothetical protein [Amycolatopsis anabasis]|uniref:hypothetical protein n=1 Tax=Amycolatopsis anabasis TaxID=1840409 RepID=UPI001FE3E2AC|nr:hypothetical protein [Amycolatopsis anabasis]